MLVDESKVVVILAWVFIVGARIEFPRDVNFISIFLIGGLRNTNPRLSMSTITARPIH
jgi:hypothetical protein